jgi:hypothetical protein
MEETLRRRLWTQFRMARTEPHLGQRIEELRAVREADPESVFARDLAELVTMTREAIQARDAQRGPGR